MKRSSASLYSTPPVSSCPLSSSSSPSQWLYLPVFMVYRVLVFFYLLIWLILHIYARHDEFGPHWPIFLSNLGFALLTISMGSLAILCVAYGIVYYTKRERLVCYLPKKDFPLARVYKQDNIGWYVKIIWCLYIVANASAILIFLGYWLFVYSPCDDDDNGEMGGAGTASEMSGDNASSNGSASGEMAVKETCSGLDAPAIHLHGINVLIVFIDLLLSRIPYQLLHTLYATIFAIVYVIFTIIYFAAGGTSHLGDPYIYGALDYGNDLPLAILFVVVIAVGCIPIYLGLFLLAWLRDVIVTRIGCCFRDVRRHPFRESREGTNHNGDIVIDEISKV